MAVGTGISAYGQIQRGKFQSAIGRQNQQLAEFAATDALDRGEREAGFQTLKTASFKSDQRAAQGKSGVLVDSGSTADVIESTELMGNIDAMTIRANAEREAYQYRVGGVQARVRGDAARTQGKIGAFSTLLTGGAQLASNYSVGKKVGIYT